MNAPPEQAQLWAKGLPLDAAIHRFTVGDDPITDIALLPYDALGSAAHALTLAHGGYLAGSDAGRIVAVLQQCGASARAGRFRISSEQEDGHTALEAALIAELGEPGKRIHLGRSRNDQVILAMRLLLREHLARLGQAAGGLASAFADYAKRHATTLMPGYTHLRRAMPSSIGQWSAAFAEGLLEELHALAALLSRLDACPAGAAAGFGAPVPLDRAYTARLLGFARVQRNPVDVQNSRGRHELAVLQWLSGVANLLEKFLWDVSLYSTQEFGFLRLPDAYTTGSSIMPQKRNPDVVELARGACRELRGYVVLVEQIATGLPSNYHRDMQLLKAPTLRALERGMALLAIVSELVPALTPVTERLAAACTPDLWAAHEASRRAAAGTAFRDAYRQVGEELLAERFAPATLPAPPDLELDALHEELATVTAQFDTWLRRIADHERDIWRQAETKRE